MVNLSAVLLVSVIYVAALGLMFSNFARRDRQLACRLHAWRWLAESRGFVCDKCGFEAEAC